MKKFSKLAILFIALTAAFYFIFTDKQQMSVLSVSDSKMSVFEKYLPQFGELKRNAGFDSLKRSLNDKEGTFAIYIKDLNREESYFVNETELFYGASLYKVPIAAGTLKLVQDGENTLDEEIAYLADDYSSGTGSISKSAFGTAYTIDALLSKLLKESDNTAQVMLARVLNYDKLAPAFYLIPSKSHFFENNTVTAEQYISLLEALFAGDFLNAESKADLMTRMTGTSFDNRVHAGLSENISFAHKIGSWPETATWHDCGIATEGSRKLLVCVLSRNTNWDDFLEISEKTGEFVSKLLN